MFKYMLVVFVCLWSALSVGEAIRCYHCYDTFNQTVSLGSDLNDVDYGEKYIQCDRDMNKWNTWDCPPKWPVCVIMSAKVNSVKKRYEIARSCAEKDFCSKYKPPAYVKVDSCRECNTTLCNDFPTVTPPGPRFVFNININLNVKKNPLTESGNKGDD